MQIDMPPGHHGASGNMGIGPYPGNLTPPN